MSTRDLIDAIVAGDSGNIQTAFEAEMMARVAERMDAKRIEVARNMFGEALDEATTSNKVQPNHLHVSDAGEGKYKVHAVGKNFADGIKVGEHLSDTELDDFSEMGGKVKHVKPVKESADEAGEIQQKEFTLEDFTAEELEDFMMSEDFEQLDELSKDTLKVYVKKASSDIHAKGMTQGKKEAQADEVDRYTNRNGMKDAFKARDAMKDEIGANYKDIEKVNKKAVDRYKGIHKAVDKIASK